MLWASKTGCPKTIVHIIILIISSYGIRTVSHELGVGVLVQLGGGYEGEQRGFGGVTYRWWA